MIVESMPDRLRALVLGLRIFEACGANIDDLGEEHGHKRAQGPRQGRQGRADPATTTGVPRHRASRRRAGVRADPAHPKRHLIAEIVQDMTAQGEPIPDPLAERTYSGKFNLRVGEAPHRRLAIEAAEEKLSINQFIVRRLNKAN